MAHADANWGPQDASPPDRTRETPPPELPLHVSRSISGFIIFLSGGPLHWKSSRQTITALSSTEAEIYATNEATKKILTLQYLLEDLGHLATFLPSGTPMTIYNDNRSGVDWCKGTTCKNTRHLQMRDNRVRECIANGRIVVEHIPGHENLADIFTKEMKDVPHFLSIRDTLVSPCL